MSGKTLLLIEPHCSGHRAVYVRRIAMAAVARGVDVTVATTIEALQHPALDALRREGGNSLRIVATPFTFTDGQGGVGSVGLARQEFRYRRLFRTLFEIASREHRPDVVLVPYLDYCFNAIALAGAPFGTTPWAGIVMRPAFHFAALGIEGPASRLLPAKRRLFLRLLTRPCLQAVFTIDESLHDYMQRFGPVRGAPVVYVPDPADIDGGLSRIQARERLCIELAAVVILVYGTIDARKGLNALFAALNKSSIRERVVVLIAGRQDTTVHELLQRPSLQALARIGRVRCLDRFLDTEEEHAVFAAANIVWMGYRDHYAMSGVMIQAGQMGLPTIACAEGLIGWMTRRISCGLTVRVEDTERVGDAILRLAENRKLAEALGQNGRNYFRWHSVARFSDGLLNVLVGNSPAQ
jgi:glycosyltransferase involved in cell wall biosynthesis